MMRWISCSHISKIPSHLDEIADQLIAKIKVAKRAVAASFRRRHRRNSRAEKKNRTALPAPRYRHRNSTGGPNALQFVLSQIPRIFNPRS